MKRSVGAVGVVLCVGCFVDATGIGNGSGGAGPTSATTGDPSTAQTTTATTATSSTSSSTTTGIGGEGGMGGAPCPDSVLRFDGDDIAGVDDDDFDIGDDFAVGAWIYAAPNPAFVAGDFTNAVSVVVSHGSLNDFDGWGIGISETFDNGQPSATFAVFPSGVLCSAAAPIPWDQWVHVAGTYRNDVGDDVRLYVNGAEEATGNCTVFLPPVSYDGSFLAGGDGEEASRSFIGAIDDVYVKHGTSRPDHNGPIACGPDYVAVFTFDEGMSSSCADALALVPDAPPGDPEIQCMQ